MNYRTLLTNPMLWFMVQPVIILLLFSSVIHYRPDALYHELRNQRKLEAALTELREQKKKRADQPESQENIILLDSQIEQLENQYQSVYRSAKLGRAGRAYQSYVVLFSLVVLFLATALSIHLPFFIRIGCLSTGVILSLIAIIQWGYALVNSATNHVFVAAAIMTTFLIVGLFYTLINFRKHSKQ